MRVTDQNKKAWAKAVSKAWADDDYKARLLADPSAMLTAEGATIPEGITVRVVEPGENEACLVLPPKPEDIDLVEADDERLAAFCMWRIF